MSVAFTIVRVSGNEDPWAGFAATPEAERNSFSVAAEDCLAVPPCAAQYRCRDEPKS